MTLPTRPSGPAPSAAGLPTLSLLRDLPLRVTLPSALETEVAGFSGRAPPPSDDPEARAWYEEALRVTQRCLAHLDAETGRLTEATFTAGDPSAVKQRVVGEPRKQVDGVLAGIKQKIANERTEWTRRYQKQAIDVQEGLGKQLDALAITTDLSHEAMSVSPEAEWRKTFVRWFDEALNRWAHHLQALLKEKSREAVKQDVVDLGGLLGTELPLRVGDAPPVAVPALGDVAGLSEKVEVPAPMEMFVEVLKVALGTVGMIAGLILVPVLGNLFPNETSTHMRAGIMALFCAPIIAFAVLNARKQRQKLVARNAHKSADALRKDLNELAKARLERFKMEVDRVVQVYLQGVQQTIVEQVEPFIEAMFRKREATLAMELTNLKLQTDKLQDQLGAVRQAKTGLQTQLVVDLRRKIRELGGNA